MKSPPKTPKADKANASTRQRLLEAAGQLFAEKGFDRTTSKEVTELAGTNIAAVNYHFGGFDGLYVAVLDEASSMIMSSAEMMAALAAIRTPKAKLRAFLTPFVHVLLGPASSTWRLRVIVREMNSPTLAPGSKQEKERLQKTLLLKGIVSEIMNLPEDHPAVARGCVSVLSPCFLLLVSDRSMLKRNYPQFGLQLEDAAGLVDHLVLFSLAGLKATAREVQREKARKQSDA
jgi:AcrR family transcriptional regulator